MGRKIAIVLFNLGGPDSQETVQPFLQNLFADPAILRVPAPVRFVLARLISRLRAPSVKENYAIMKQPGGGSPLRPETEAQARALEAALSNLRPGDDFKAFIAMRYWHPLTRDVARAVEAWEPDETVLLPLYPQYSSTTTGSSLGEWRQRYRRPTRTICCYPFNTDFIAAHAERIVAAWEKAGQPENVRLLMSAHGLPEKVVEDGDPYQWQVEEMAARLVTHLPDSFETRVCYQSRVGPLKWIGPATEDEIELAAKAGKTIMIAPIAFVSEHIETLVELDYEYREVAEEFGAQTYITVPALGTIDPFIKALADEVAASLDGDALLRSCQGGRLCPKAFSDCPFGEAAAQ
ncbi:MAG: ferrochelatase [Pseudomonadota bacterium]